MLLPSRVLVFLFLLILTIPFAGRLSLADGPADNRPDQVRPVPPIGIELSEEDRQALTVGLKKLDRSIEGLQEKPDEQIERLLPDVEIFSRAIHQGLEYQEFFATRDVKNAKMLLQEGQQRAEALLRGDAPWTHQKGLVVRGFRSKIDRTVQPYGLVIPESYSGEGKEKYRVDLWFHGRGERSSEPVFLAERMTKVGRYAPQDTIVLHPYGRYSNAFKFAGEVDVLEALSHVKKHYRVDEDRVSVRGFSMGGAGCWQMAVHYPDLFFAANPGAGFSETAEFLKSFQQETLNPTWYEKKLWQLYDCPGYAINLFQLPTVAYSGELDIQKQAADVMEQALEERGLRLTHVVGPQTKHSIHPESMQRIEAKLDRLAEPGRFRLPQELQFATYTLKYNRVHWLTLTALGEHWKEATVSARLHPVTNSVELQLRNVTGLRCQIPAGRSPFAPDRPVQLHVISLPATGEPSEAAQTLTAIRPGTDRSWECEIHLDGEQWKLGSADEHGLRKRHDLQGPIDDAFMDSFIVVRPTGASNHPAVGKWVEAELERTVREWRRQFRGDAIVKRDVEINEADIAENNLILFGDPASNRLIASLLDKLPLQWSAEQLALGGNSYDASHHAPVMIYPNPDNPSRYIVLNSGFTYREYAYLNNARQVPKLPDWAVVDLRTPPDSRWPGKIVKAGFFDEKWQLP